MNSTSQTISRIDNSSKIYVSIFLISIATMIAPLLRANPTDGEIMAYLNSMLIESNAPSISVAIGSHEGFSFAGAVGFADIKNNKPATRETLYRTGSIAKVVTTVAVMQQIEKRVLGLDSSIFPLVPEFPRKEWDITVEHLMTHTSGIRHYARKDFARNGPLGKSHLPFATAVDALTIFAEDDLAFQPGTGFMYSTYSFTLLQAALESAVHSEFETHLERFIWQPARMNSTSLEISGRNNTKLAVGYQQPAKSGKIEPSKEYDVSYKHAGGGMISNPTDLVRFAQALQSGKLLEDKTLKTMYTRKYAHLPKSGQTAYTWRVGERKGQSIVHMGGSIDGFKSFLVFWPDEHLSIAVMANQDDFEYREKIAYHLGDLYLNDKTENEGE